jgi:Photosynthesis system II assembly factor YCF48
MAMLSPKNGVPVAAAVARRLLTRLLCHRPGGRPGTTGVAACLCAGAVVLAGCYGGPAGQQAAAASSTRVTGLSQAASGTWRAESSGTRQRLYDVACLSALRCEAVGAAGTIVSTVNGGRTWRAQANPLRGSAKPLYQIACVAPSSCYVIARPDTILVTHDGGAAWSRHMLPVGVPSPDLTDQACLPDYAPISGRPALCRLGLLDIACVSARVCYAVSTAPPAYGASPVPSKPPVPPSSIWLTRNGGATWTRQSVPPGVACNGDCGTGLYPYPLVWVSCLSSGLCRAGGGHVLGCGHCGFAAAVLVSRGPGRPWACTTTAAACTSAPDVAGCPASTRCYGVDSTNPFAGPDISVLRSADGGASWQQAGPDWTTRVLTDIACPAALTCYLAGSHGTIARITNGTTVTAQRSPTARDLYGIGCAGPAACYAVGDNGTILARR